MKQPNVSVYGSRNCPDTTRTLHFLDSSGIPYEFKDLDESPELNGYIADLNGGKRVMPTIQIDNAILINPDDRALESALQQAASERP
jgi:glutaredoxin